MFYLSDPLTFFCIIFPFPVGNICITLFCSSPLCVVHHKINISINIFKNLEEKCF